MPGVECVLPRAHDSNDHDVSDHDGIPPQVSQEHRELRPQSWNNMLTHHLPSGRQGSTRAHVPHVQGINDWTALRPTSGHE